MLSEKQHIDDFFRQKEEAFTPDEQHIAAHWQQMQQQMADPGPASVNHKNGSHVIRNIGKYLGGLLTVVIITILAINLNRSNKKAISKTTNQQATIVTAQQAPATNQDTPLVLTPATKQAAANVFSETTPVVNKNRQPDIAMTLISPPVTKGQPVDVSNESTRSKTNETKTPNPNAQALLRSFFDQLKKEEQAFYIQANRDTTLYAKEGTRLDITANSLISEGKPVKGQVEIVVREFFTYEDIIANKLSTTSNRQQLVTGGMVHISAQQNGKTITIAPDRVIQVNIPTNNYDDQMQVFTGQEMHGENNSSTLNWLPAGQMRPGMFRQPPTARIFNVDYVDPFYERLGTNKKVAKFRLSSDITISKKEITEQIQKRYGNYYDKIKFRVVRAYAGDEFSFEGNYSRLDSVTKELKSLLKSKYLTVEDSLRYVNLLKQDSINYQRQLKLLKQYSFGITQFGWVNCDRFLNDSRPKVHVTVNVGKDIDAATCFTRLVFTRYQSVMLAEKNGDHQLRFWNLPEGEPAILITISTKDDKVVSSIQPLNISGEPITNLTFEPATPEAFRQKLKPLLSSQKQ